MDPLVPFMKITIHVGEVKHINDKDKDEKCNEGIQHKLGKPHHSGDLHRVGVINLEM